VDLEERSGLGGDVDSGVRSTLGGRGSDEHLRIVNLEDTTARSPPGGYGGHADITGTEDKAGRVSTVSLNRHDIAAAEENCEHRLVKPGQRYGHGGHRIVSNVSFNRDKMAEAEDTGWMPQWRIVSTISLNRDEDLDSEDTGC
jgi:hypothetical protein